MNDMRGFGGASDLARRLLLVPVLHTEVDMGDLSSRLRDRKLSALGFKGYRQSERKVSASWDAIEAFAAGLPEKLEGYRVYQDGLPVCGREAEIVEELAERGSRNHKVVAELCRRGAKLMGTEAPDLLREELDAVRRAIGGPRTPIRHAAPDQGRALLDRRDRFIADRIASTLAPGETGILFIGLLHDVAAHTPPDIVVEMPVGKPEG